MAPFNQPGEPTPCSVRVARTDVPGESGPTKTEVAGDSYFTTVFARNWGWSMYPSARAAVTRGPNSQANPQPKPCRWTKATAHGERRIARTTCGRCCFGKEPKP